VVHSRLNREADRLPGSAPPSFSNPEPSDGVKQYIVEWSLRATEGRALNRKSCKDFSEGIIKKLQEFSKEFDEGRRERLPTSLRQFLDRLLTAPVKYDPSFPENAGVLRGTDNILVGPSGYEEGDDLIATLLHEGFHLGRNGGINNIELARAAQRALYTAINETYLSSDEKASEYLGYEFSKQCGTGTR
jgi:hypothetical protein